MNHDIREKIRILAGEALSYFEYRKRNDGTIYWTLREGAPGWMYNLVWESHGEIFPEDFRYLFIVEALEALAENPEEADSMLEPDIYTSELIKWLNAHPGYRAGLVDEAVSEFGWDGLFKALQAGQLWEKEYVLDIVREFLEREVETGGDF